MFEVGFSKVRTYRYCNKAYDYAYNQNIQARRRPAAPFRGTILHKMLEAWENAGRGKPGKRTALAVLDEYGRKYARMFQEEREFYGENFISDIERIFLGYLRTWSNDDWQVLRVEEEIRTPLTRNIEFVGHVDLRIKTLGDGRRWLVDRKSHKVIPDAEERYGNTQLMLYVWAWNRENPDRCVDGIIWDYLRTKAPTVPEVLKKGGLTQRMDLDTDVYTYECAIEDNKLDVRDYEEYLSYLEQRQEGRFFQRVPLPNPPQAVIGTVLEEFKQTATLMHRLDVYPRNMTARCKQCEFWKLCKAELTGLNAEFTRKADYEPREVEPNEAD